FGYLAFGYRKASPGRSLEVDDKLAGVSPGKEGQPDQRKQPEAQRENNGESGERQRGPAQDDANQPVVELQERLKTIVEPNIKTVAGRPPPHGLLDFDGPLCGGRSVMRGGLDESHAEQRYHGESDGVGSK